MVRSRSEYTIEEVSDGRYIVRKGGHVYYVGFERAKVIMASCNCPDWRFHSKKMKVPCKHIWLVAEREGHVSFPSVDVLPPSRDEDDEGHGEEDLVGSEKGHRAEAPPVKKGRRAGPGKASKENTEVEEIDIPLD